MDPAVSPGYSTSFLPQGHWPSPLEEEGSGHPTWSALAPLREALTVPKLSPLNLYGNTEQRHRLRKNKQQQFLPSS